MPKKLMFCGLLVLSMLQSSVEVRAEDMMSNIKGYWADKAGDKQKALVLWKDAIRYGENHHNQKVIALNCDNVASLLKELKNYSEAQQYYERAAQSWKLVNSYDKAGISLFYSGQCFYFEKKYAEAEKFYLAAGPCFNTKKSADWIISNRYWLAYSQYFQGKWQDCKKSLKEQQEQRAAYKGEQFPGEIAQESLVYAIACEELAQFGEATAWYKKAIEEFKKAPADQRETGISTATHGLAQVEAKAAKSSSSPTTVSSSPPAVTATSPAPSTVSATKEPVAAVAGVDRPIRDKWALVIGISKFERPAYNLKFAAKDATDFKTFLTQECNFAEDHVKLLLDEQATRKNIMSAFGDSWLPRVAMPDDLVVVYVSTHGTPGTTDPGHKNYIVAWDTDGDEPFGTGVNMNDLCLQIKERVNTDRVLIVMDTCYSGAAASGARGIRRGDNFNAEEIAQGAGRLVISSSSPNQQSWESKSYSNGIFTHNLIESLRKESKQVDILTAFKDMQRNVQWEVQSTYGTSQTPMLGGKWDGVVLKLAVPASERRQLPSSLQRK